MKKNQQKPGRARKNPIDNLNMENELLKLKLRAENGAEIGSVSGIDPSIENVFLKNVIEFEKQFARGGRKTVYEMIGKPAFKKPEELADGQISSELDRILGIMSDRNIGLDFLAEYPDAEKYRFITGELFQEEMDDIFMPGMVHHFIYEEYHPNHTLDITRRAMEFINGWFERKLNQFNWALADHWVTDKGIKYPVGEVLEKFGAFFGHFRQFKNKKFEILEVHPDVGEGEETGMGYVKGTVKYNGITGEGEKVHFEGPFKLYLQLTYGWWAIHYAQWPGLEW